MAVEQYANLAQDTLNGGINNSVLSLDLNDASEFPSSGNFRLLIDTEILICTARTGNTLTVLRGQEGTVAASHSNGATVTLVATAGSILAVGSALHRIDTFANRPAAGVEGREFSPTNGYFKSRDNGSAWQDFGPQFPLTAPVDGDFAWENQGSATVSVVNGGIHLHQPARGTGPSFSIRIKTAPTVPYVVTAGFIPLVAQKNFLRTGLIWRQSSDGKLVTVNFTVSSGGEGWTIFITKWNSPTSFSADYANFNVGLFGQPLFLRIEDDNTDRKVHVGYDGQNFQEIHSVSRTDFLTADQVGFFVDAENQTTPNFDAALTLLSWKEE